MAAPDREFLTTAFMVVAQRIEPALLGELAARISGLDHLEAAVGPFPWHLLPMTAIRLRGAGATHMLPYGLGRALEHRLSPDAAARDRVVRVRRFTRDRGGRRPRSAAQI